MTDGPRIGTPHVRAKYDPERGLQAVVERSVLDRAQDAVYGNRHASYGHPRENHATTAALVTAYLRRRGLLAEGAELSARDVCWLNIFQKASRDAFAPGDDNLVDTAGYAENAWLVGKERT